MSQPYSKPPLLEIPTSICQAHLSSKPILPLDFDLPGSSLQQTYLTWTSDIELPGSVLRQTFLTGTSDLGLPSQTSPTSELDLQGSFLQRPSLAWTSGRDLQSSAILQASLTWSSPLHGLLSLIYLVLLSSNARLLLTLICSAQHSSKPFLP